MWEDKNRVRRTRTDKLDKNKCFETIIYIVKQARIGLETQLVRVDTQIINVEGIFTNYTLKIYYNNINRTVQISDM